MTTRMATAASYAPDSAAAAAAVVAEACGSLGGSRAGLAILYCGSRHDYAVVLSTVRAGLGQDVPLVGASTAGEFTASICGRGGVALALLASDDMIFYTGLARGMDRDLETALGNIVTNVPVATEVRGRLPEGRRRPP